ncbi:MAG: hypothetical protein NTW97_00500 [Candidatus Krumholzibacteria bacterium]|nr:hypothetical protein [Candidatus Krumholzibacteria bacterium]
MVKMLLAVAVIVLTTSSSFALPETGYIGLFADATHDTDPTSGGAGYNVCPPQYGQFQCWIWCLPSVHGLQALEFAISFPPTVVVLATTRNYPDITMEIGSPDGGISIAFGEGNCRSDWLWTHNFTCMSLAAGLPAQIRIVPHPGVQPMPAYQFASCGPGYPIEPCIILCPLYICYPYPEGPLGIEQTNWGSIKSLF